MSKWIVQLRKVKNILSMKTLENIIHHKKDCNQVEKKKKNINKQLTEIRHNKHKNYLQSKNLKRDKNQSNKEASRCTSMAKSNCSNHW